MNRIFLVLLLSCAAISQTFAQQSKPDPNKSKSIIQSFDNPEKMFRILEGKWAWAHEENGCLEPYIVTVASDRKTIAFTYSMPRKNDDGTEIKDFIYDVIETGNYYIRGKIQGEKRLTEDGKPVVWDFYFFSNDEFRWHRTDWKPFATTPPIVRCKEKSNSIAKIR